MFILLLVIIFTATINEQSKISPKELKLYEKLKALNQFHKRSGEEGILHMRVKEKRNQVSLMKKFKVIFHY